jgi:hypothetical protein
MARVMCSTGTTESVLACTASFPLAALLGERPDVEALLSGWQVLDALHLLLPRRGQATLLAAAADCFPRNSFKDTPRWRRECRAANIASHPPTP